MAAAFVSFACSLFFLAVSANAQLPQLPQGCSGQLGVLLPCLPFVQGNQSSDPTDQCCNALGGVVNTSPVCLCALVAAGPGNNSGVNATLALGLPARCKMTGVSASLCNNGTSQTGAASPVQSPIQAPSNQSTQQQQSPAPRIPISIPPAPSTSNSSAAAAAPKSSTNSQMLDSAHPETDSNVQENAAAQIIHLGNWNLITLAAAMLAV